MATRRQQASAMSNTILKKYKMPTLGAKENGYDGIPYWKTTQTTIDLMRHFRNDVLGKNKESVSHSIQLLLNDTDNEAEIENLVRLLIDRSSPEPTKEALLTAVLIGSRPLVEFILQLFAEFPGEEMCACAHSDAFPSHITPLMLAAFCNNYAIVECLLLRDHKIQLPHRPDCVCQTCLKTAPVVGNQLARLDSYRALASEAFLWLGTKDPMLAAINLANDLEACMGFDSENKEIYAALLTRVQTFSGEMIQQCRTLEEVDCLLEQQEGASLSECHTFFPRCRIAVDAHMKPMLSHVNLQMSISSRWMGAWSEGKGNGRFLRHTLGFPILALIHAVSGGLLVQSFKIPHARYLSYAASYLIFILAILSLRFLKRFHTETVTELVLEIFCFVYIFGQIVAEFLEFSRRGLSKYFELWWRWFDFVLLYVFVVSFICWVAIRVNPIPEHVHRKHWVPYDPAVLYEIFFGTACLMAVWRIFYFIQLDRMFGSTVISIGRCVGEVFTYFAVMGIVIISFGLGLSTILQPYADNFNIVDGSKESPTLTFPDVFTSVKNLFWGFFGYMNPVDYRLRVGNAGPHLTPMDHYITKISIEFLAAFYYIITVITLLNLMVSLLVKKADEVLANEDVEWKYTRVHIYLEFFEETNAVPPPFNLIYLITLTFKKLVSTKYKFMWPDLLVKKSIVDATRNKESCKSYNDLLITLFHRYRCSKFYHYRTMQKMDADDKKEAKPLLAFLNFIPRRLPHQNNNDAVSVRTAIVPN